MKRPRWNVSPLANSISSFVPGDTLHILSPTAYHTNCKFLVWAWLPQVDNLDFKVALPTLKQLVTSKGGPVVMNSSPAPSCLQLVSREFDLYVAPGIMPVEGCAERGGRAGRQKGWSMRDGRREREKEVEEKDKEISWVNFHQWGLHTQISFLQENIIAPEWILHPFPPSDFHGTISTAEISIHCWTQMENLVDLIETCIVGYNWDVCKLFQCQGGTDSRCAMHQAHITDVHSSELELILLRPHPRLLLLCVSCQWCVQQQQRLRGWHFQEPVLWTLEAVRQSPASLSHKS